jgi:hypothetical protein
MRCIYCASGHTRTETLRFAWNETVAKQIEVVWCANCDRAWILEGATRELSARIERAIGNTVGQPHGSLSENSLAEMQHTLKAREREPGGKYAGEFVISDRGEK